jgi:hypothetical protein
LLSVRLIFNKGRNQNLTADDTDQTDFQRSREAGTKERECAGSVGENRRKGLDLEEETITALLSVRMIFNKDRRQNLTTDNTDQTDFH